MAVKTKAKENKQYPVHLRSSTEPVSGKVHTEQDRFVNSTRKRIIVKAGRRGGKTVGMAKKAAKAFNRGKRVLYAAPTSEQTDAFWFEIKRMYREPIDAGILKCNESERYLEVDGTQQRIKAKTAWNANSLRGDFAELLIFDEYQLMNEDSWQEVGQPMLLDNNGDAAFIFTPPSLQSAGISKAKDPRHASKLFKQAQQDITGLWETVHFTSHDNPFISEEALSLATANMTMDAYRREIMAMDDDIEQSWLVYGKFNEVLCKIRRFEIPKTWSVYSGHDFGMANPAALFVARNEGDEMPTSTYNPVRHGDFVIFKEYCPGGADSFIHAQNFKEILDDYKLRRSVGGNRTGEDEIRQAYGLHGWHISPPKFTKIAPQIDRTIGMFELNKIFIFEDLHNLLLQLANCLWILDDENHPTNKIDNEAKYHLLAALRYIISDFEPETYMVGGKTKGIFY